ncbi:MAG: VOC family protein, partial [Actinomycetota bacterium]|nr:VOC family protein [Actinomycetota bacterium]
MHLAVADADRAQAFYQDALGLQVHGREEGAVALGAGAGDLVVLHEEPGARPAGRHAGLFHVALLHPSREELAQALARVTDAGVRLQGAADHGVSEALYLADPDGNGLELY